MMKNIDIQIKDSPLDVNECLEFVRSEEAGGIDIFVGTVRNQTEDKKVLRLEFESYAPMAIKEIAKIVEASFDKWPLLRAIVHHRIGTLQIGEEPVIIAVSSKHRAAAFEACRYIIDELKKTVPIWKKEYFEGGEVWVNAHP